MTSKPRPAPRIPAMPPATTAKRGTIAIALPDIPDVQESYIGYLPALELLKLVTDEHDQIIEILFTENPRDWLGNNDVNEEIDETLRSDSKSRFVLMNNGVTIIA